MINYKKVLKRTFLISLLLLITNVSISCNQPKEKKTNELTKAEKIEEIVGLYSEYEGFNGAVLVSHKGETIEKEGIDKGMLFYIEYKDLDDYYVSEQELIVAGYRFLHVGNAKDAAKIFKLSTEVFPDRDNPYDSYAEALMALGKNKEAIKNYKKSLELNPKNYNAVKMLKKLGVEKP